MTDGDKIISNWNEFPTVENPNARYKFASFSIMRESDVHAISRQTYGVLAWMGDWGGLMDALKLLAPLLIMPFENFAMASSLAKLFVRLQPKVKKSSSIDVQSKI